MGVATIDITESHLLVVEGKEEEVFFGALIKHLGLQKVQIIPIGGKKNLRQNLKILAKSPQFKNAVVAMGIVRDADDNPAAAFQSVSDALQAAGLSVPESPSMPAGNTPKITIMILPEGGASGMLEDLCLKAVENDNARICVEQYFQCLQQKGLSFPRNMSKARVQVFLASRSESGKRLGEAAEAGYWPWDNQAFAEVKKFIKQIDTIES